MWSNGLQGIGDQLVSGKTVLPWIFGAAGVPGFFTALLVPVRESGSMLPQAALTPWVTTYRSRSRIWRIGSMSQAVAAALMAVCALLFTGWILGMTIVILLGVLACGRALCSIASKDVQGRTISKGRRGRITGRATALSGAVALIIGLGLSLLEAPIPHWILVALLGIGAASWALATLVFARIHEPVSDDEPLPLRRGWWQDTWGLFLSDAPFLSFVIVRSLLLVSALSTTFVVTLSQEIGHSIAGLGTFVVASALASLVGGRISGIWSDQSSKTTMALGSAVASVVIVVLVIIASMWPDNVAPWALPIGFFLIQLAHTAVRVARKTYLVDMAEGDQRTRYTGAANTLMGVILLIVGGISGVIALAGSRAALLFLALIGFMGVAAATRLRDVSAH